MLAPIGDLQVNFERSTPGKEALVFVHSLGADMTIFDAQANGEGQSGCEVLVDFIGGQVAAAAGVYLRAMLGGGLAALGLQLFWRAEAAICLAFVQQALRVLGVNVQPLGLAIGT